MYLPGIPCDVIQRGNWQRLGSAARRYRVDIYAYVLRTNHVHLLMAPERAEGAVGGTAIRSVHQVDLQAQRHAVGRRHKASLVHAEDYLFTCQWYIELNPVRAGMVEHPGDYRWSSHRANAFGSEDDLVTPHELYRRFAPAASERQQAYRELFRTELDPDALHQVRSAAACSMPLDETGSAIK